MKRRSPQDEAAGWIARLTRPSIDNDALRDVFAWRRKPANKAAYEAASKARRRQTERFHVEPGAGGFSVIDVWTGDPATFANRAQTAISEEDAEAIAEILNRRALRDEATARH